MDLIKTGIKIVVFPLVQGFKKKAVSVRTPSVNPHNIRMQSSAFSRHHAGVNGIVPPEEKPNNLVLTMILAAAE